jgi:hypothetical protein
MVKVDRVMMDMAEVVLILAAARHVQDNRGHVHRPLVEDMADLVAHHRLDPLQVDLEEEEEVVVEEEATDDRLQVQEEAHHPAVADHHLEVLLWADLHLNAGHRQVIHTDIHQTVLRRNVGGQMSRVWRGR